MLLKMLQYLESDDPELYKTKVCYIRDNDVTGLGQMFVEEEYTSTASEPKVTVNIRMSCQGYCMFLDNAPNS